MERKKRQPNLWIIVVAYTRKKCNFSNHGRQLSTPIIKKSTEKTRALPKQVQKDGKKLYRLSKKLYDAIKDDYKYASKEKIHRRLDKLFNDKYGDGRIDEECTTTFGQCGGGMVQEETLFNDSDFEI